jgi:xylulokinase
VSLFIGFDASTQSLTALVIEIGRDVRRVVFEHSLNFDEALPHYGTRHGVLSNADPRVAVSPPLMWAEALELMFARLRDAGVPLGDIAAISGSAQQHGSVYVTATPASKSFDPEAGLAEQIAHLLSRSVSPIWMDSNTTKECREIEAAVGGESKLAERTGSRAFERFTAAQIRHFWRTDPAGYARTGRVHLVSSFLASLLIGGDAPLDPGDASGMNLMDLRRGEWWPAAVAATAPGLASKLPAIVRASTVIGTVDRHWQARYGIGPAPVIVWSGDNPSSLVGVGLVRRDRICISLGTSDTVFGPMMEPRVHAGGIGHVFASPTGGFMGLTCFKNGSLARECIRDEYGLSWRAFSAALESTTPGNLGGTLLPWFEPEITPHVPTAGVRRYALPPDEPARNVRAVVEGQAMALARHSAWMGIEAGEIYATGGASVNRQILQVIADVFGADVYQSAVTNAAALGAALRAAHGYYGLRGEAVDWEALVDGLAPPPAASRVRPVSAHHEIYERLRDRYAACEAHALGCGPDPGCPPVTIKDTTDTKW